jgi:alpha-tubulin suppressor-like RCC1 family protein
LVNVQNADPELNSWSNFIELLNYFRQNLECSIVDLMGCSIYSNEDWKYILNKLSDKAGVTVNSSVDDTGAESLGGNWILESNNSNLIGRYFTEGIKDYKHVLGSTATHSIFLTPDGQVYACGFNGYGQLGDGTTIDKNYPVQVKIDANTPLTDIISYSAGGNHSLFLKRDGTVYACGLNSRGQLGDGTTTNRSFAVQVKLTSSTFLTDITAISTGVFHSLFLKTNGTVYACGFNGIGQLGHGTTTNINLPVQVKLDENTFLTDISAISGGYYHSLFLKSDGTVYACGYNYRGQLGDGTTTDRSFAVQVKLTSTTFLTGITSVSAGVFHSLFLKSNETVYSCGYNYRGELGDGTTTSRNLAVQVKLDENTFLTDITAISGGGIHSLFLKNNGEVYACGWNELAQLGDGTITSRSFAVQVKLTSSTFLTDITAIIAGNFHSLFFGSDGTVYACGSNSSGQLGDGTNSNKFFPIKNIMNVIIARVNGLPVNHVSLNDFTNAQKKLGGYTDAEIYIAQQKSIGVDATQLKSEGYNATQMKYGGYTIDEMKVALYEAIELREAGYTIDQLKTAGYNASEMKTAGYNASELKTAGYTIAELNQAEYTPAEVESAGFPALELINHYLVPTLQEVNLFTTPPATAAEFNAFVDGFQGAIINLSSTLSSDEIAEAGTTYSAFYGNLVIESTDPNFLNSVEASQEKIIELSEALTVRD